MNYEMDYTEPRAKYAKDVLYKDTNVESALNSLLIPEIVDVKGLIDSSLINKSITNFSATLTRLGCLRILAIRDLKFFNSGNTNITFMTLNSEDVKGVINNISVGTNDAGGNAVGGVFIRTNGTVALPNPNPSYTYELFGVWTVEP